MHLRTVDDSMSTGNHLSELICIHSNLPWGPPGQVAMEADRFGIYIRGFGIQCVIMSLDILFSRGCILSMNELITSQLY